MAYFAKESILKQIGTWLMLNLVVFQNQDKPELLEIIDLQNLSYIRQSVLSTPTTLILHLWMDTNLTQCSL